MKKTCTVLAAATLLAGLATTAQAAITTYSSYFAFINAVKPTTLKVENFVDTTLMPGFSITEVGGAGSIHDGGYENIVDKDVPRYQIFNYSPGMFGFGVFNDSKNPGGPGTSIDLYINDTNTFALNIPNWSEGQFYGFTSDTPFTGVRFQDGNGSGAQETYYNIDCQVAPTPIPAAAWLMVSGLLGVVGLKRKKNHEA
jgi:hypothetical protein